MSETIITAVIGVIGVAIGAAISIITTIISTRAENKRNKVLMQQKDIEAKRKHLDGIYKKLISVINLFPKSSPKDILKYVEYAPNYSMESFDSVIKSLDYQIEDYKNQLNIENIDYQRKSDIETQISNREYSKKRILEIKDAYFDARDKYRSFCEKDKVIFNLYAGTEVRNCLVQFEVMIHNVFISGYCVGADADDPLQNCVNICRRDLINSMRYDLGIE